MNPNSKPAQIAHNLHYFSAKADTATRLPLRHATPDTGLKLVGAVGIEFATPQSKSRKRNGVAPPPLFNWSLLEPTLRRARLYQKLRIPALQWFA
jgi:hypothetical protein